MKPFYFLFLGFLFCVHFSYSQTNLAAGDIVFIGLNSDGDDDFSLLLLKDITAGTSFYITDKGWNDGSGFRSEAADGTWLWSTTTALSAGDIIYIKTSNNGSTVPDAFASTPGTMSWVHTGAIISYAGDQVFIYQGTHASPTFIAGVHWNVEPNLTSETTDIYNWDQSSTSVKTSALPNQLANGTNAIWLFAAGPTERDNFKYNCSTTSGTPAALRTAINNISNWDVDASNTTAYTINPFPCSFTVSSATDVISPVIACAPTPSAIVAGSNGKAAIPDLVKATTASDDVSTPADITIVQSPAAGAMVNTGVHGVVLTATDQAGNFATCTINVTVNEPPSTTLSAGDIAFIGINSDGNDDFAFVLLKDIIAGTKVYITDHGWIDGSSSFRHEGGDGVLVWYATGNMSAGTIVHFQTTNNGATLPSAVSSQGSITGNIVVSQSGDQLFIYQGTSSSPTFITGIHWNVESTSNSLNWDDGAAVSLYSTTSDLPDQLTNGVNAIWVYESGPTERDNFRYKCSAGTSGSAIELRALFNNINNWDVDPLDNTPYTIKLFPCAFTVLPACTDPNIPTVSTSPTSICSGNSSTLTISGNLNDATAWQVYTSSCSGTFVDSTTTSTITVSPESTTTYYIRGEGGCATTGSCGTVIVTVDATDSDGDGIPDVCDNCPDDLNSDQIDTDGDGFGDMCDFDDDNDGVLDGSDTAPLDPDICEDTDGDGCDDCSVGTDGFGPLADNLPANDGIDTDSDGLCDSGDSDDDNDGVLDAKDPDDSNPDICGDTDNDGCDDCAIGDDDFGPNPDNSTLNDGVDTDGDGMCDSGDTDDDNDGVPDISDPDDTNPDICGDVNGDGCDDCDVGTDNFGLSPDNIGDIISPVAICQDVAVWLDLGGNATVSPRTEIIASSVDGFSSTQGQNGWWYGECLAFSGNLFPMQIFTGFRWEGHQSYGTPYINSERGHPGVDNLAWSVRRWVSSFTGSVNISGDFFDKDVNCGDGANIRILINNVEIFQFLNIQEVSTPYSIDLSIAVGDIIDFVIDPNFDAGCDDTYFTAIIKKANSPTIDNGSWDGCGIQSMILDKTDFNCNDIGTNLVKLTVADNSGNISTCNSTVTVSDTISPKAVCNDLTVYLDEVGSVIVDSLDVASGSTDNCTISTIALSTSEFSCSDVGDNDIIVTVNDNSGNTDVCTSTVTIEDTIKPTVLTKDVIIQLDADGNASITAEELNNGSSDNCEIDEMILSQALLFAPFPSRVKEFAGREVTFSNLNLNGTGQNSITAKPGELITFSTDWTSEYVSSFCPGCVQQFYIGVKDLAIDCMYSGGTSNTVRGSGSISFNAPLIPGLYVVQAGHSLQLSCTTTANGISDDISDALAYINVPGQFDCSNVGPNTVAFTVTDVNGNSSSDSATVTVMDSVSPIALCQDTTVYLDVNGNVSIDTTFIDNGSIDACGIATMTIDVSAFDCSNVGANAVVMTVTDMNSNVSTCISTITVVDTFAPEALCQDITIPLDDSGSATIDPLDINNGSSDACEVASMTINKSNFDGTNIGANPVVLSVTDVNGNVSTCTSNVTVRDTIAPVALCKNIGIALDQEGRAKVYPVFIDDGSTDEGGIVSYSLDVSGFTCADIGPNTVVLSVRDVSGNVSTCTSNVTVNDSWLPEVACKDFEVSLNAEGIAVIDSSMMDNGSSAMCGISGIELSQSIFTGANLGENSVTMTVTNKSGVTASCEATITVKDEIAPVASCNSIDVWLSDSSVYELSADDILMLANGSNDNASPSDSLQIEVTPTTFDCSNIGDSIAVDVSITDQAGNESSCEAMVYVKDSTGIQLDLLADIEISLAAGVCETAVDYPEIFTAKACATFTQLEGLGADGLFPVGTTVETWEATNGAVTDTVSFSVIVSLGNAVPTLDSIANVTVNEDETPISVALSGISGGNDCIAQEVTVTATNKNIALVTSIEISYTAIDSAWVLNISFATNESGSDTITVVVEDSEGAKTSRMFALEVAPVNDAPVLVTQLEDVELNANDTVSILIPTPLGTVFDDIDDTELDYTVKMVEGDLPDWVIIMENDDEVVLSLQTTPADTGCYNVVIEVMDASGATASDTFEVCVEELLTGIYEKNNSGFEFTMYPNPSQGMVSLDVTTSFTGEAELYVMSITGQQIFHKTYLSSDRIKFDLSDQVSGSFLVILQVEGKRRVKKLVLDRK